MATTLPPVLETKRQRVTEDWLAVCIGLFIFAMAAGDLLRRRPAGLGRHDVSLDQRRRLSGSGRRKPTPACPGIASLFATYVFLLVLLGVGASALGADVRRFAKGFTAVFFISYGCWIAGSWAYIAATPDKLKGFGIAWSLNLTVGGRVHHRSGRRAGGRQLLPRRAGVHEGGDPAGVVRQDRHCDPRAVSWASPLPSNSAWPPQ